jgi:gamma-glutamyltranspeptidase/glutathione hydrolase
MGWILFLPFIVLPFVIQIGETSGTVGATGAALQNPVRDGRYPPIVGTKGMVSSSDRQASEWGVEILRQGGNAIDAAVATGFALAVTRPQYASLGGGGFLVYCPKSEAGKPSKCSTLDYREKAPSASSRNMYIKNGKVDPDLPQVGSLASGIPGTVAGLLDALEKYGTFQHSRVLKRPIELAEKGYLYTGLSEDEALERWTEFNPETKRIFGCAKNGAPPTQPCPAGSLIKQKDLAEVLKAISKEGKRGFYTGKVAGKLVNGIQKAGGLLTLQDLKNYQTKDRMPVIGHFQNYEIVSMAPPSSGGGVLIQMLGYTERAIQSDALKQGLNSAQTLHALTHAMSLAFADRAQYFGDPDFVEYWRMVVDLASDSKIYQKAHGVPLSPTSNQAKKFNKASQLGLIQPEGFPGLPPDWESDYEILRRPDYEGNLFLLEHHLVKSDLKNKHSEKWILNNEESEDISPHAHRAHER